MTSNQNEQPKNGEQEIPKTKLVATQHTFRFPFYTSPAKIDKTVNEWIMKSSNNGTPVMLGKITTNPLFIYYVFLFSRKIEIK